jgi:hypothetical protein
MDRSCECQQRHRAVLFINLSLPCGAKKAAQSRGSLEINDARVAKLADTPDLGLRKHQFQSVAFLFKKQSIYQRKMRFLAISGAFTTDE